LGFADFFEGGRGAARIDQINTLDYAHASIPFSGY
jgi:hypothetical protein